MLLGRKDKMKTIIQVRKKNRSYDFLRHKFKPEKGCIKIHL